ncbi:MAG: hypothetical protein HYV20_11505 [Gemmatimonadetes bacterium]|nr:hypothetical protein [Gemmatimonadota bacterium]
MRDADGYFVVGLLQTSDPQPHLDVIADRRKRHRYLREFRYSSNDSFRVDFARSLIEYFATAEDLGFAAGVVAAGSAGRGVPYATHYRRLIGASGAAASDLQLHLEVRTSDGTTDRALADALAPLARVTLETTRRGSELLQVADFLAGCIYGDLTLPGPTGGKAGLIAFLKAQLGVSSFADRRLAAPGRFRVFGFGPTG